MKFHAADPGPGGVSGRIATRNVEKRRSRFLRVISALDLERAIVT